MLFFLFLFFFSYFFHRLEPWQAMVAPLRPFWAPCRHYMLTVWPPRHHDRQPQCTHAATMFAPNVGATSLGTTAHKPLTSPSTYQGTTSRALLTQNKPLTSTNSPPCMPHQRQLPRPCCQHQQHQPPAPLCHHQDPATCKSHSATTCPAQPLTHPQVLLCHQHL